MFRLESALVRPARNDSIMFLQHRGGQVRFLKESKKETELFPASG
jgi:hypothetical protein